MLTPISAPISAHQFPRQTEQSVGVGGNGPPPLAQDAAWHLLWYPIWRVLGVLGVLPSSSPPGPPLWAGTWGHAGGREPALSLPGEPRPCTGPSAITCAGGGPTLAPLTFLLVVLRGAKVIGHVQSRVCPLPWFLSPSRADADIDTNNLGLPDPAFPRVETEVQTVQGCPGLEGQARGPGGLTPEPGPPCWALIASHGPLAWPRQDSPCDEQAPHPGRRRTCLCPLLPVENSPRERDPEARGQVTCDRKPPGLFARGRALAWLPGWRCCFCASGKQENYHRTHFLAGRAGSSDSEHTRGFREGNSRAAWMARGRIQLLHLMVSRSPFKAIIEII